MDAVTPSSAVARTTALVPVRRPQPDGRDPRDAQPDANPDPRAAAQAVHAAQAAARGALAAAVPFHPADVLAATARPAGAGRPAVDWSAVEPSERAARMRAAARAQAAAEVARLNTTVRTTTLDPATALQRLNRPMGLGDAVLQLIAQLPEDIELGPRAGLLPYPDRGIAAPPDRILGYQFRSTEGRHIATWIPELAAGGATLHAGSDGRGRVLDPDSDTSTATVDIGELILAARYPVLDPGPSTPDFRAGWRQAEADLLRGVVAEAAGQVRPERRDGYFARMQAQAEWETGPRPDELRATLGWGGARNAALEEAVARLVGSARFAGDARATRRFVLLVGALAVVATLAWVVHGG